MPSPVDNATLTYDALDIESYETRILRILPGVGGVVKCLMDKVSLINPGAYIALSYCWGDPEIKTEIIVNDYRTPVTWNLEAALQSLRAIGVDRIWVDALCINQKDRQERSLQVRSMKQIYSRAERVIAWIGGGKPLELLGDERLDEDFGDNGFLRIKVICQQPYWTRAWIIQEIAVASEIILLCGRRTISWDKFCTIVESSKHALPLYISQLLSIRKDYQDSQINLLEGLQRSADALATDPRDKLYALLGLCHDGPTLVPYPNYVQPFEDIMCDLSKALMRVQRSLELLCLTNNLKPRMPDSPSWATNWIAIWNNCPRERLQALQEIQRKNFRLIESDSSKVLKTNGLVLGAVAELENKCLPEKNSYYGNENTVSLAFLDCLSENSSGAYRYKSILIIQEFLSCLWNDAQMRTMTEEGKENISSLLRTINSNLLEWFKWPISIRIPPASRTELHEPDIDGLRHLVVTWLEANVPNTLRNPHKLSGPSFIAEYGNFSNALKSLECTEPYQSNDTKTTLDFFIIKVARAAYNKLRLVHTKTGIVGLVHYKTQQDDLICLMEGCEMAIVLRQKTYRHEKRGQARGHQIIGEAHMRLCEPDRGYAVAIGYGLPHLGPIPQLQTFNLI